jgi:hypothetical protein
MGAEIKNTFLGEKVEHPDGSQEKVRPARNPVQKVIASGATGAEIGWSNLGSHIGSEKGTTLKGAEAGAHEGRHALGDYSGGGVMKVHKDSDGRVRRASYTTEGERTHQQRVRMAEAPGLGKMSDQDIKVRDSELREEDAEKGRPPEVTEADIAKRHAKTVYERRKDAAK